MRIASIAARTIRWMIASHGAARGRTERAAVVIEVRTDRGVVGLGEAAPLPGMSIDALEDAERLLAVLAQRAPFALADRDAVVALATAASCVTATSSAAMPPAAAAWSPAACFAIETALLDALARAQGVSLSALLASPAGTGPIPLAAVVDDPEAARQAVAAGIQCLKIKLLATDDPGRAFAIAAAAPNARLRIDANRTWPRAEVAARLAALAALPIDFVEEPCVDAHLLAFEPLACQIALDESLALLPGDDLRRALRGPRLAALVLKPTLLGGLSAALSLAELARQSGVAAIASHALEGPVGTAACAELALALGGAHAAGLAPHAGLAGWLVDVSQLTRSQVCAAGAAGLGFADLDLASVVRA